MKPLFCFPVKVNVLRIGRINAAQTIKTINEIYKKKKNLIVF